MSITSTVVHPGYHQKITGASKTEQHQDNQFLFCQEHEHDFHGKLVCQEISFQMQNCYTCYAGETSGSEENESESNVSEMYER